MPYFSFSLDQIYLNQQKSKDIASLNILPSIIYFSKNTKLWKVLNKNENSMSNNFVKFEERKKVKIIYKKILFFLPPSIGLGDAIEYALAIKAIKNANIFTEIGVAFVSRYKKIFIDFAKIENVYEEIISLSDMKKYDTLFHVSLEIVSLKNQKYSRTNIEKDIIKYFNVKKYRTKKKNFKEKIDKITIFPISKSPIRTMPIKIMQAIIDEFSNKYEIEFILDKNSIISKYIDKKIDFKNSIKLYPENISLLINIVMNIKFGIFMDSGPLHLAKIYNKKGILIESSVGKKILLDDFNNIQYIPNNYKSDYCEGPCGLTNIFNFKNISGCYQTLEIKPIEIKDINQNFLQRGALKKNYTYFIKKPVGCLSNINIDNLFYYIKRFVEN